MSINLDGAGHNLKILTVPGLHGSGSSHWQTRWEKLYGFSRVEQENWDNPYFSQWVESLYHGFKSIEEDVETVLVAHSLGCHLVVKSFPWIRNHVKGVFLVAPPDLDAGIIQQDLSSFSSSGFEKLDVPGYLIYSENDPYASTAFSETYGHSLGIERINIGKRGHINSYSNLGNWDEGAMILDRLLRVISILEPAHV